MQLLLSIAQSRLHPYHSVDFAGAALVADLPTPACSECWGPTASITSMVSTSVHLLYLSSVYPLASSKLKSLDCLMLA